jgi:universal stress protein A
MTQHDYRNLLLAVDFAANAEPVIARALQLRTLFGARLSLVHVLEYIPRAAEFMPMSYAGDIALPDDFDLEKRLLDTAQVQLDELGERLGVPPEDRHLQIGPTGHTIQAVAEELGTDLVILGCHGRHGLKALLGGTAKGLVQGLSCDALCVRIPEGA